MEPLKVKACDLQSITAPLVDLFNLAESRELYDCVPLYDNQQVTLHEGGSRYVLELCESPLPLVPTSYKNRTFMNLLAPERKALSELIISYLEVELFESLTVKLRKMFIDAIDDDLLTCLRLENDQTIRVYDVNDCYHDCCYEGSLPRVPSIIRDETRYTDLTEQQKDLIDQIIALKKYE